jgi:hypothetical protein
VYVCARIGNETVHGKGLDAAHTESGGEEE